MPASAGRTTAAGATVMSIGGQSQVPHTYWHLLARRDVLAGLLFVGVALLGLWLSRDYPIGTALRMGTGYVPRLLCWILLGLGTVVLVQGLRAAQTERPLSSADMSAPRPHLVRRHAGLAAGHLRHRKPGDFRAHHRATRARALDPAADRRRRGGGAGVAAGRDRHGGAGVDRSLLGHLHSRAGTDDPGLAGVVDGAAPQPLGRIRG